MNEDTTKSRRTVMSRGRRKRILFYVMAMMCMPLNAGCDIAKVMAAIGQLVSAIAPNTGASGASAAPGATPIGARNGAAGGRAATVNRRPEVVRGGR